jgi:PAS domain S-box-containing protein
MAKKPTYEELEQKLKEYEIKLGACKIIEKELFIEKQFSESAINSLPGIFYIYDKKGKLYRWNKNLEKVSEYSFEEISKMNPFDFFEEKDRKIADHVIQEVFRKGESHVELEVVSKSGKKTPYYLTGVQTKIGNVSYLVGMGLDITERKKIEEALLKHETELEIQSHHLQDVNSALKVLLRYREEDKIKLQESIVGNLQELVFPYLEKLSRSRLDNRDRAYIEMIQSSLNDILSPFIGRLSSKFMRLTPTEVQVANLIKHGKTTKDIAEMLNLSVETIKFHRKNIRKKMGIKNKKANLRINLLSIQ